MPDEPKSGSDIETEVDRELVDWEAAGPETTNEVTDASPLDETPSDGPTTDPGTETEVDRGLIGCEAAAPEAGCVAVV